MYYHDKYGEVFDRISSERRVENLRKEHGMALKTLKTYEDINKHNDLNPADQIALTKAMYELGLDLIRLTNEINIHTEVAAELKKEGHVGKEDQFPLRTGAMNAVHKSLFGDSNLR